MREPTRLDVAVFRLPQEPSLLFAKRCLGLPGEKIEVRAHRAWVDGRSLAEGHYALLPEDEPHSTNHSTDRETHRYHGPLEIPPDHFFFLGDNRPDSLDSRERGSVPRNRIYGRIVLILWSTTFEPSSNKGQSFWDKILGKSNVFRFLSLGR